MSDIVRRQKLFFPYFLIIALLSISAGILGSGWFILQNRRQQRLATLREDEARRILGIMVSGSQLEPYLTRIGTALKPRLLKLFANQATARPKPHLELIDAAFPGHELWAFQFQKSSQGLQALPVLYPSGNAGGRRGMARILNALTGNARSTADDKLADFMFGPGQTIHLLSLRRGMVSRIIYRNQHHLLLWDTVEENGHPAGGFFLLVPDSHALTRYSMTRSARLANAGRFHLPDSAERDCIAGYLRIFPSETGSIFPAKMLQMPELADFLRKNNRLRRLAELESEPLPWAEKYGSRELYTRAIPYSNHLAFVFLPTTATQNFNRPAEIVRVFVLLLALMLLAGFSGAVPVPSLKLKTRFSLLFLALAAIPFSLVFAAGSLYLEEFRVSLIRETRQKLHQALLAFDQGVEDTYLRYRSEFQKFRTNPTVLAAVSNSRQISDGHLESIKAVLADFSPPLPWGALMLLNPEGKGVEVFRSAFHKSALTGYSTFNRVGMLDAMRKGNSLPELENASSSYISDRDVAVKKAFETLVRLPVCHGFVNKLVGKPAQVAFGSFSIVRIFDYFPSAADPELAVSVTWLEDELDWHFCSVTLEKLRREYPGSRFAFFRERPDGLKTVAQSHSGHNLSAQAFSASLGNVFSFRHKEAEQTMEVAFASIRRPGIILAGEMETGFIEKRVGDMTRDFFLVFLAGIVTIVFFSRLLTERLIKPFLLLQKSLTLARSGRLEKLPGLKRRDEISAIFRSFNEMLEGLQARQRLLSLVSGNALHIARETQSASGPGKRASSMIILVSDIRDFTTLCEKHPPDIITRLLNLHFDRMSQIIYSHGGEISRFVGDAIEASFPFYEQESVPACRRAVAAGLLMLHTMKMINEERQRQGLFTYRIGIGLASGVSHFVQVGSNNRRTEILQLNKALKKAAELESLSRDFGSCPMVIEKKIGQILERCSEFSGYLQNRRFEERAVYVFAAVPPQSSFLTNENVQKQIADAGDKETDCAVGVADARLASFKREAESVRASYISFLPGLLLLLVPFLIILTGIFFGYARNREELVKKTHDRLHHSLEIVKNPLNKKEIVESHVRQTLHTLMNRYGPPFTGSAGQDVPDWQATLETELRKVGLIPEEIVLAPAPHQHPGSENPITAGAFSLLGLRQKLRETLNDCLRCYGQQFDRFLLPEPGRLKYLGDYMSGILLVRDTRARFESVNIASESFWLYWQPLLRQSAANAPEPQPTGKFGRKSAVDYSADLAGGIIILCRPPAAVEMLRPPPSDKETAIVQIDVKDNRIIDTVGNTGLLAEFAAGQASASVTAGQLIAAVHQTAFDKKRIAVAGVVSKGEEPAMYFAAAPVPSGSLSGQMAVTGIAIVFAFSMLFAISIWYRTSQEEGLATTVRGQILGSFTGMLLLPLAGLFTVLVMLAGDWQTNLVNENVERFGHQVDQIEQQIRLHHSFSPQRVQKMLAGFGLYQALKNPEERSLQKLLQLAYNGIMRNSQALGVNSLMVDAAGGQSEFLAIDGSLSPAEDPMKRAFSFHARRILDRLDPDRADRLSGPSGVEAKEAGLVDEITTQLIFEILDSTFGSEASLEILFGQNKAVELFSSVSNDVLFQDFFPDPQQPLGTVFTVFSHLHSNIFAVARILAARHALPNDGFSVFSASRLNPGMPLLPETGERLPFIREAAAISILTGPFADSRIFAGEEYYLAAQPSITFPQFVFTGVASKKVLFKQVYNRLLYFVAAISLFLLFMLWLSLYTARDITVPLEKLLAGISRLQGGDFRCRLSFDRADELEEIAEKFNDMVQQLGEKDILVRMVSESAAGMAHSAEAESDARLGVRRKAAVVYLGINGFDQQLNRCDPLQMQSYLSSWVELASSVVAENGGEIDKILEGKVLAVFFAAPGSDKASESSDEHVARAFNAAISVCKRAAAAEIVTSCGIHAGEVISGLMGNQERRDFTIIGDTVNMSARCFAIAEKLAENGCVVASRATAAGAAKDLRRFELGSIPVKGKQLPVRLVRVY